VHSRSDTALRTAVLSLLAAPVIQYPGPWWSQILQRAELLQQIQGGWEGTSGALKRQGSTVAYQAYSVRAPQQALVMVVSLPRIRSMSREFQILNQ